MPTEGPGDRIKALREALRWTQLQLAARGGMPQVYVSRVEIGKNKLTGGELRGYYARAFGVSIEELVSFLNGHVAVEEMVRRVESRALGAPPPPFAMPSASFVPDGIMLGDLPKELRDTISADEIPPDHRPSIPDLVQTPLARAVKMTSADWLAEAKKLAERNTSAARQAPTGQRPTRAEDVDVDNTALTLAGDVRNPLLGSPADALEAHASRPVSDDDTDPLAAYDPKSAKDTQRRRRPTIASSPSAIGARHIESQRGEDAKTALRAAGDRLGKLPTDDELAELAPLLAAIHDGSSGVDAAERLLLGSRKKQDATAREHDEPELRPAGRKKPAPKGPKSK